MEYPTKDGKDEEATTRYPKNRTGRVMAHGPAIRFAIIGDVEPKPEPDFGNLHRVVDAINVLHDEVPFAFIAGTGDIAHRGTELQYRGASEALQRLPDIPVWPILGNEEYGSTEARFFEYVRLWNRGGEDINTPSYVRHAGGLRFVFATARQGGKELTDEEVEWIGSAVDGDGVGANGRTPAFLFTHQGAHGIFPDAVGGRSMKRTELNKRILPRPNLMAVFSGHSHMNVDTCQTHVCDEFGVHHVHIPGIERTKVGGEHIPRFRMVAIEDSVMTIHTMNVAIGKLEPQHTIRVSLRK